MKTTRIVFQGDSITDCGRPYELEGKSYCESLGHGYVKILAGTIALACPRESWVVHNRGISGNKITQLFGRWQTDAINLQPDIISILVGVNDVWHGLPQEDRDFNGVKPGHFERTYRHLLAFTREELPEVRFILGQPFLIKGTSWTEAFAEGVAERSAIVSSLADEFDGIVVPYQEAFNEALEHFPVEEVSPDGVHPTNLGNSIMARAWMEAFHKLHRDS